MSQAKKKNLVLHDVVCCLLGFKFGALGLELLVLSVPFNDDIVYA